VVLHHGLWHDFDEGCVVFMREHWLIFMQGGNYTQTLVSISIDAGCMKILGMT